MVVIGIKTKIDNDQYGSNKLLNTYVGTFVYDFNYEIMVQDI